MKPSERRALLAEKRAQKEAEERERELERAAREAEKKSGKAEFVWEDFAESEPKPEPKPEPKRDEVIAEPAYEKPQRKEKEAKGDGYHRESFWSNHSRLIAFIITTVVVLFVAGPLGYDIYLNVRDAQSKGDRVEGKTMTVDDVYYISENADAIKWSSFENFKYTDYGEEREFAIEGTDLTLRVGKAKDSAYPEYVRLIHYRCSYPTEERLIKDIRTVSDYKIEEFIKAHADETK